MFKEEWIDKYYTWFRRFKNIVEEWASDLATGYQTLPDHLQDNTGR
jgi:hypothetical protein